MRGPRPAPGLLGISHALESEEAHEDLKLWWEGVQQCLTDFAALFGGGMVPLDEMLRAHLKTAEALAGSDKESGADRLWREEAH